jgi:hypothetical protein
MKLYIHKDTFYPDNWSEKFKWLLTKKYKDIDYEIVNLHYENNINDLQIGNDDYCICRFAHYEEDFELSKRVYPLLYEKFKGRIWPNKIEWYYYNDKQRQLEFFKKNNIPHPISHYSYGRYDLVKWVTENNLGYPIVVKKSQGAGAEEVGLVNNWREADFPVIAQQYIDVNHDVRISIFGDKILFGKRVHHWKTDEKKRFPYGWYYGDKDSSLDGENLIFEEIEDLRDIAIYLKEITDDHLKSKIISWDIIDESNDLKVCEFSYCFEHLFLENSFYYDTREEKILKMKHKLKDNRMFIQNEILKLIKE